MTMLCLYLYPTKGLYELQGDFKCLDIELILQKENVHFPSLLYLIFIQTLPLPTTNLEYEFMTKKKQLLRDNYGIVSLEPFVLDISFTVYILFNFQLLQELKKNIEQYKPLKVLNVDQARVLLVGQVGAGKSSFFNTINSIFRGYITSQACSGNADHSLTTVVSNIHHFCIEPGLACLC
jgi:hypothetical protein